MRHIRPDDGERLPGDEAGLGITRPEWHQFLDDLLELNRAGALSGIRAIVDERLRQVRNDSLYLDDNLTRMAAAEAEAGEYADAGALLAAQIDRKDTPWP